MRPVLFMLVLAACGDRAELRPDAGDPVPGDDLPTIGRIEILETRAVYDGIETPTGRVIGSFLDGPPPRWHRETMRAGACALRVHTPSSCSPACASGLCNDGECQRWASYVSAGTLTVQGLTTGVTIAPVDGWYYPPDSLPANLFADTATVTARLTGGALPAMTLTTTGVPPLVAAIADGKVTIPYPAGTDFVIRWTPAADDSRIRLTLNANNQGHGFPFLAILECDVADSAGELAIPAAMLDAFPETFASSICAGTDCPPSLLRRYHRATQAVGEHAVELVVASELQFGLEHDRP
ncbi:MAG: hypothetical protein M3680_10690 [Myxococcota bacterium]|nr:hypothetical protein [Myxococcota bacterium]